MPKFTKCGKEIDELLMFGKQTQTFRVTYSEKEGLEYEQIDASWDFESEEYACPKCREILFTNENDAFNFLKNGVRK